VRPYIRPDPAKLLLGRTPLQQHALPSRDHNPGQGGRRASRPGSFPVCELLRYAVSDSSDRAAGSVLQAVLSGCTTDRLTVPAFVGVSWITSEVRSLAVY
jgi:hypothetical protein